MLYSQIPLWAKLFALALFLAIMSVVGWLATRFVEWLPMEDIPDDWMPYVFFSMFVPWLGFMLYDWLSPKIRRRRRHRGYSADAD